MLISVDQVPGVIIKYVDTVLKPKVEGRGDFLAFKVGVARYALPILASKKITEHAELLKTIDILTENNMIDIENAVLAAKDGLSVSGRLSLQDYSFDNADVEALARIARGEANAG